MELFVGFLGSFFSQFQSPTLGFLVGGMFIAALGSRLSIPDDIYKFIVFMLLMKIGIKGGLEIREAQLSEMILPAIFSVTLGLIIVLLGKCFFSLLPNIRMEDGIATAGLFGAVSASTFAAATVLIEERSIDYEAWVPALYPFMDIPALVLAILLANIHLKKDQENNGNNDSALSLWGIVKDSLQGSALSAMILGFCLGLLTDSGELLERFYEPLFRGFLSILMLVMGMEAYARMNELRKVAHWYAVYACVFPILHGLIAFGLGYIAHLTVGFSAGGTILLAVMAASSSDISGPPTLRSSIPSANPSTYIGSSTSVGTPIAIAVCIPLFITLAEKCFH